MGLILGVAAAAVSALYTYNRMRARDPVGATETITSLRQASGVLLALGRAAVALLDALQLISRPTSSVPVNTSPMRMGAPAGVLAEV